MRPLVLPAIIFCSTLITYALADDMPAARLEVVRKTHSEKCERLREEVEAAFDKRDRSARSEGDKKILDQLATVRRSFELKGELPSFTPSAAVRRVAAARLSLEIAYATEIRKSLKVMQDSEAEALEKELRDHLVATRSLRFLTELTPTTVAVDTDLYSDSGKINGHQVQIEGHPALHSIFLHAKRRGHSLASFRVNRTWSQIRGEACIPRIGDELGGIGSPVVFEILGDNKVLWTSKPIQEFNARQQFQVDIDKAEMLHLRVKCVGEAAYARALWIEPTLVR